MENAMIMNHFSKALLSRALCCFLITTPATGFALQRVSSQQQNVSVTTNEGIAIKSLRALLDAETKFQSKNEKGDFGQLKDLQDAGLIDDELARGLKGGYQFSVMIKKRSLTTNAAIDLVARPTEYGKTGRRSFYLTESGVLLTSDVKDAPLDSMRPFASGVGPATTTETARVDAEPGTEINEEEIASKISANEAAVIAALGTIHAAEIKFAAKEGGGSYGTLAQLEKAGLISKAIGASTQSGYVIELTLTAGKAEVPAAFGVSAVPQTYGGTGRRTFFVDQTGIVRGADKEGFAADQTDPAIK